MLKVFYHYLIITLITFIGMEVILRILTIEKPIGYEYLLGKNWRYILPFRPEFSDSDTSATGRYRVYHPNLGWDIGRQGREDTLYYSNGQGIRCTREDFETGHSTNNNNFDVICIGNSFTHGDAVTFEKTWPYLLEKYSGRSTLNLGVGGYGIDQATLKLKEKLDAGYTADTVILGLVSGDLDRTLFTIYNFYSGGTKTKPKFVFEADTHRILNQPCLLRACSGILKPGVVSNFVVTKHQSNDQTVRRTNRLPVGCNIRIFQLKTQAQTGFAQHLQRLVVYG